MASLPEIEKLCMNCMNAKPDAAAPCPHCGSPAGEYAASSDELAPRTILFGRYLLGRMTGRSNTGILYAAYDLKRCERTTIREYFPKAYVKREYLRPGISRVVPINEAAVSPFQSGLEQSTAKSQQLMQLKGLSGLFVLVKCFSENGTAYAVLEDMQGVTLRRQLENNGGTYAGAVALLQPLVSSLARMHGAGVFHGEISVGQMLLTPEGTLGLLPPWGASWPEGSQSGLFKGINGNARFAQDTRAMCAVLYTLLSGKEPPPLSGCGKSKDIPSLINAGVSISRQKEHVICKGLCGGYRDAQDLHWALYGAASPAAGIVRGRDNNATISLEKAVRTISSTGGGKKKVQPAPSTRNGSPFQVAYAAFSAVCAHIKALFRDTHKQKPR